MSSRYRAARALGRDEYNRVVKEDTELLDAFGLRLLHADSGIRAAVKTEVKGAKIHPWNVVEIDGKVWGWLRPLLVELRESRDTCDVTAVLSAAAK